MVQFSPDSINGGTVTQRPALGEELTVMTKGGDHVNIGQVSMAEYETASGTGFVVRAARIKDNETVYVHLADERFSVPLIWN